jgi:hypothetical protein
MVIAATSTTTTRPAYPAAAVASVLLGELISAIRRRFRRKGVLIPRDDDAVVVLAIELDSLTVVELLSSVDDILPFKVTERAVKAGGYLSIADAVRHVTMRVESQWNKYHEKGRP